MTDNNLYLFFDTETTGTPLNYKAPMCNFLNWPRMVQLAFALCDHQGETIVVQSYIVKPLNFDIPKEAETIHGISTEIARREGHFLQEVLQKFGWCAEIAGNVVCHNYNFDSNVCGCEFLRCGLGDPFEGKKTWCTMDETKEFVGIPNKFGFKYPKLIELYIKLFDKPFSGAHDAKNDILATVECFYELRKRGILKDR
jgi:DNA polymerase III epsilon subunit-like protein